MAKIRKANAGQRVPFKRAFAKTLRINATDTERKFWCLLRGRQLDGFRFRRQQPIGPDVVDFFCSSARLIVELDGGQHGADEAATYDSERTRFLESRGYRVLRFWNGEVMKDAALVIEAIHRAIRSCP